MKRRILLVEDEPHIADAVALNLEIAGYEVVRAEDGAAGYELAERGAADLVILDIMLPEMDGLTVCSRLRRKGNHVPILFLTAKDRDEDKVRGLEAGGDDYLTKPFAIEELLARVRGMFRRQAWFETSTAKRERYAFAAGEIDFGAYEAWVRGKKQPLTEKEVLLLRLLVENEGRVVDRFAILDHVWGYDNYPTTRAVDNLVLHLRKIFEEDPAKPRYLHTVYGAGYRFTPKPED